MYTLTKRYSGFTLVELMIALTIGLLLVTGLTLIFVNSSNANRELQKTGQQIENGRYAIALLSDDLRLAGYYGHLYELPAAPASLPDPCETASATNLQTALALPVQGYRAPDMTTIPDITATSCNIPDLKPGSDVVVVRRADTNIVATTSSTVTNEVYIQATGTQAEIQFGAGAVLGDNKADGTPTTLRFSQGTPAPPAYVRKFHVHVYFVATCSVGSGTNGVCQSSDDKIPTLKRLELTSVGGNTVMKLVPMVEGVDYLKIEYGRDDSPTTVNADTGLSGDSTVDDYTATPALVDWPLVIAAKVYVLARNTDQTLGYKDTKTYTLGTATVAAPNDMYKRHVYTTEVRLVNTAGRREIP